MPATPPLRTTARYLIVLRHGPYKAGDQLRKLTERGKELALACGESIKDVTGTRPTLILTTRSYCALETGQQIGQVLGDAPVEEVVWLTDAARPRAVNHDIHAAQRRLEHDGRLILVTHQGQLRQMTNLDGSIDYCHPFYIGGCK